MSLNLKSLKIRKNLGIGLTAFFGVFMLFGIIGSLFSADGALNLFLGSLLLFGAPLIIGIYLMINAQRNIKKVEINDSEKLVLNLASQYKGILTQTQLAKNTDLTLAESGAILNEMTTKGFATVEVTDIGVIEYHFESIKESN